MIYDKIPYQNSTECTWDNLKCSGLWASQCCWALLFLNKPIINMQNFDDIKFSLLHCRKVMLWVICKRLSLEGSSGQCKSYSLEGSSVQKIFQRRKWRKGREQIHVPVPWISVQQGRQGGARPCSSVARPCAPGRRCQRQGSPKALDWDRFPHWWCPLVEGLRILKFSTQFWKWHCWT